MQAKGSGAYGNFTVTHDITQYTRTKIFSKIGKKTDFLHVSLPWLVSGVQPMLKLRSLTEKIVKVISVTYTRV
mgnify:CR=1 FL=1